MYPSFHTTSLSFFYLIFTLGLLLLAAVIYLVPQPILFFKSFVSIAPLFIEEPFWSDIYLVFVLVFSLSPFVMNSPPILSLLACWNAEISSPPLAYLTSLLIYCFFYHVQSNHFSFDLFNPSAQSSQCYQVVPCWVPLQFTHDVLLTKMYDDWPQTYKNKYTVLVICGGFTLTPTFPYSRHFPRFSIFPPHIALWITCHPLSSSDITHGKLYNRKLCRLSSVFPCTETIQIPRVVKYFLCSSLNY